MTQPTCHLQMSSDNGMEDQVVGNMYVRYYPKKDAYYCEPEHYSEIIVYSPQNVNRYKKPYKASWKVKPFWVKSESEFTYTFRHKLDTWREDFGMGLYIEEGFLEDDKSKRVYFDLEDGSKFFPNLKKKTMDWEREKKEPTVQEALANVFPAEIRNMIVDETFRP